MHANELRIGNWVKYSEDGTIFKVVTISPTGLTVESEKETEWIEIWQFEPVILSEDWLVKCGANKKAELKYIHGEFTLNYLPSYKYWYVTRYGEYCSKVEYVHEWQNLYFALTGKELEIKL
jgi:hypothetical protein